MTNAQLVPALVVPFIAWRVYLRARRSIGRQPFQPNRLLVRIGIFSVVSLLMGAASFSYLPSLAALAGGLVLGGLLSLVGLRLTRFEDTPAGKFYTPNTALGVALLALFVGRIAYRLFVIFGEPLIGDGPAPRMFQSPLTLLIFGLTAGYYIAYNAGVLVRAKRGA
jgi:hypothetical protein